MHSTCLSEQAQSSAQQAEETSLSHPRNCSAKESANQSAFVEHQLLANEMLSPTELDHKYRFLWALHLPSSSGFPGQAKPCWEAGMTELGFKQRNFRSGLLTFHIDHASLIAFSPLLAMPDFSSCQLSMLVCSHSKVIFQQSKHKGKLVVKNSEK